MDRYICVHGHFYQPPRENPWLREIEQQSSAAPWHDWNERIADECYAPNTDAPVGREDDKGQPVTLNTFSRISFDTGPTLLSWLERSRPGILEAIREADRSGRERFSGHGPAMAQAYNHLIQPLADSRDRQTQILWGISDFRHRFGRDPQGLWLPETAVDIESLDLMAAAGVRFTILASHQAAVEEPIDPTLPYLVRLPSGREMSVFFYDDELGNAVSFGGLLNDREVFLRTLLDRGIPESDLETDADSDPDQPRLIHLATDGETFGHHVKGGEETLAWTLDQLEHGGEAERPARAWWRGGTDHLRRVSRTIPGHPGDRDQEELFLELSPRSGAVAVRLRLFRRTAVRRESCLAGPPARGSRLVEGFGCRPFRAGD